MSLTLLCRAFITAVIVPVAANAQSSPGAPPRTISYAANAKAPAQWTVGGKPILEIGGADAIGPTEFTKITGIVRQTDGTVVVANSATGELRFFDSRGQFLRSATRPGQGPGELQQGLDRLAGLGDTLFVADGRLAVHVYAPNGKWLRSLILPAVPGYVVNPAVGALNAFDAVVLLRPGDMRQIGSVRLDSIWLARVSLRDTTVRRLIEQPNAPRFGRPGDRPIYSLGFAPPTLNAIGGGRICSGYPERYEVLCSDSLGNPLFSIVRATRPRPVSDSARRAFREAIAGVRPGLGSMSQESFRKHCEELAAMTEFAKYYPAYSRLMLARTGELWVRSFATADGLAPSDRFYSSAAKSYWSIYDRDGQWIADCVLPPHFAPAEIGAGYVIGVSRDHDEIERVTLLSLGR